MASEFESERKRTSSEVDFGTAMIAADQLLRLHPHHLPSTLSVGTLSVPIADVSEDLERYHRQADALRKQGLPAIAVKLELITPTLVKVRLKVLVDFDVEHYYSIHNYDNTLADIANSGLDFEEISAGESADLFRERSAEFIAVRINRFANLGSPNNLVTVETRRDGDQVLYAKGYFYSTKTVFGISNPASKHLLAGRYDFGIMDGGRPLWNGLVWDIPHPSTIFVPLP